MVLYNIDSCSSTYNDNYSLTGKTRALSNIVELVKVVHHTYIAIYIAIRNEFFFVFSFIFDTTRTSLFE